MDGLKGGWSGYAWAAGACAACTLAGLAMQPRFDPVNIAMVYLLAVVIIALRESRGAAIAAAALCVLAFDVVFVPPRGALTVDDAQYLLTFAIMGAVALVISGLVADLRRQARAQAELELEAETERIRGTLLASISHDLRTPLAVLAGASSSLAEGGERMSPVERAALAGSLYRQARDMSEQVDKLLQMTRLEAGGIALARDWSSLAEIAEAVIGRLAERLAGHRLIVDLPRDLPLLHVDATLVEQALGNLLENAARHTPPGTLVRLRAWPEGGSLVVSVEDFGPGLADGDLERVFAKFSRGDGGAGGLGLGLAICRSIVSLHGGRAWAEQLPGGFTAFRFSLPLKTPPAAPAEAGA
jgi:two-component system sensor histidine kinase KdpD